MIHNNRSLTEMTFCYVVIKQYDRSDQAYMGQEKELLGVFDYLSLANATINYLFDSLRSMYHTIL